MRTLLIVMNPRQIAECTYSLRMLDGIDRAWVQGYNERELCDVVADITSDDAYDRFGIIADDTVVSQRALDAVLDLHAQHPDAAVSGWSNVDSVSPKSNIMTNDLRVPNPTRERDYDLLPVDYVRTLTEPFAARFSGLTLHFMSRELWAEFPFGAYGGVGWASDYHLAWRLQKAGVRLFVHPRAEIHHVKETWNERDAEPRKQIRVGPEHRRIIYDRAATDGATHS